MAELIPIHAQTMLRQGAATAGSIGTPGQAELAPGALPLVSVVVPAYNEELVLAQNLARIHEHLGSQHERYTFELIVVDDGSRDRTGVIADAFAATHTGVRVLHHRRNGNLGSALRTGFAASRGDYVVTLDCDLTYDPAYVDRLLDALEAEHADLALASAYLEGGRVSGVPALRLLLSRSANRYLSGAVHGELATLTCMVRAYRGPLVRSLPLRCTGTDINTEILAKARVQGARVVEIPAHLDWASASRQAPGRLSSAKLGRSIASYLRAGVLLRPSALFSALAGVAAMVVTLSAVAWLVAALRHGVASARHDEIELVVVGAGAAVVAVIAAATAFLTRLVTHYYEELFLVATVPMADTYDGRSWEFADRALDDAAPPATPDRAQQAGRTVRHR